MDFVIPPPKPTGFHLACVFSDIMRHWEAAQALGSCSSGTIGWLLFTSIPKDIRRFILRILRPNLTSYTVPVQISQRREASLSLFALGFFLAFFRPPGKGRREYGLVWRFESLKMLLIWIPRAKSKDWWFSVAIGGVMAGAVWWWRRLWRANPVGSRVCLVYGLWARAVVGLWAGLGVGIKTG